MTKHRNGTVITGGNKQRAKVADFLRGTLPQLAWTVGSRLPQDALDLLPADTGRVSRVQAGIHLALTGDASQIELGIRRGERTWRHAPAATDAFVVRCDGASQRTPLPAAGEVVRVDLPKRSGDAVVRVFVPETIELEIVELAALDGEIIPAPRGPRWVVYGDSITQGWSVTEAGLAWPSRVAETLGLDLVNLGFAGAARGEVVAANVVAGSEADLVTLAWGTNSWSTVPTDASAIASTMRLFLTAVRGGLPDAPIVVISPLLRPDAEQTPNRFGATHVELRDAIENAVAEFTDTHGDDRITLVPGRDLMPVDELAEDRVHPEDAGHATLAARVTAHVAALL